MKSIVYTCTCIHSHTGTFIFYKLNVWSANADFSTFKHKYIHSYIYTCIRATHANIIHACIHIHMHTRTDACTHIHIQTRTSTNALQIGVDWTTDIGDVRTRLGHDIALQGNIDPTLLFASQVRVCVRVCVCVRVHVCSCT